MPSHPGAWAFIKKQVCQTEIYTKMSSATFNQSYLKLGQPSENGTQLRLRHFIKQFVGGGFESHLQRDVF